MKLNEEIQARIDKYLLQTDTSEERVAFEQEMATNPELKQEVEIQQQMYEDILVAGTVEFRAKLDKIHAQKIGNVVKQKKTKVLDMRQRTLYTIATIAAAILIFFLIRTFLPSQETPEQLFAANSDMVGISGYQSGEGGTDSLDVILSRVNQYVLNNEFDIAIELLETYTLQHPQSARAYKDLGVVLLKAEQPQKAKDSFQKAQGLAKTDSPTLLRETLWGISLSYLKIEPFDKEACQAVLEELAEKSYGIEQEKVNKLLQSLANLP